MSKETICCICRSEAVRHAAAALARLGFQVVEKPAADVTHLLLPVPSFPNGAEYLAHILTGLPDHITVIGGNLQSPLLEGYRTVDLLRDPYYLAENAAITARCALRLVKKDLWNAPVLILGWGRIGKCLGKLLEKSGADVTIAARNDRDLAMIRALGYHSTAISRLKQKWLPFDAIFNTVPAMILPQLRCPEDCSVLELASVPGMSGEKIISARGLPGKMAPKESGALIAETIVRLMKEEK